MSRASCYPFQAHIADWAFALERAAAVMETGMGKSRVLFRYLELVLERHPGRIAAVFAPLATRTQLVREARAMGASFDVRAAVHQPKPTDVSDGGRGLVVIINYELAAKMDLSKFVAVVLDESSVLRSRDSKTAQALTRGASTVRYRLALTATPAPDDATELESQAAFLGVSMARDSFFVGRTVRDAPAFARWLSGWSVWVRSPEDVGFPKDAARYVLPPLHVEFRQIGPPDAVPEGAPKRAFIAERVAVAAEVAASCGGGHCIVWAHGNEESRALAAAIPGSEELTGTMRPEQKEATLQRFGDPPFPTRVLVVKPSIAGMGLNWAHASTQIFSTVEDSHQQMKQAIARSHRFGATEPVRVVVLHCAAEAGVRESLDKKNASVDVLWGALRARMRELWTEGASVESLLERAVGARPSAAPTHELPGGILVGGEDPSEAVRAHAAGAGLAFLSSACVGVHSAALARELRRAMMPARLAAFVACGARERNEMTRLMEGMGFVHADEFQLRRTVTQAPQADATQDLVECEYAVLMRAPGAPSVPVPPKKRRRDGWERALALDPLGTLVETFCNEGETVVLPLSGREECERVAALNRRFVGKF